MTDTKGLFPDDVFKGFEPQNGLNIFYSARCGSTYAITGVAGLALLEKNDLEKLQIGEYIRRHAGGTDTFYLSEAKIEQAGSIAPPSISVRYTRGLLELTKRNTVLGKFVRLSISSEDYSAFLGATYSNEYSEAMQFLREYAEAKLINGFATNSDGVVFNLTTRAYLESEKARQQNGQSYQAFVAMWFHPSVEEIWTEALEPSIRRCGYEARRIDKKEHNNKIDDEIIAEIRASRFIVADFTSEKDKPRGGVYFEAGYALAFGLPVIWTCKEDLIGQVHFDTRQFNHITWTDAEDLNMKLETRIKATIGQGPLNVEAS